MQFGPIMNGGVTARPDAAVRYRTILRVGHVAQLNVLVSLTKNLIFTKGTNNFINNL